MKINLFSSTILLASIRGAKAFHVWNTFEDSVLTGGVEALFQVGPDDWIHPDKVEVPKFPKFLPPMKGDPNDGMYDIDLTRESITFTLVDGTGGTDLVIPDGRFDRYYFDMLYEIEYARIVSTSPDLKATVEVIPPRSLTDGPVDLFGLGIDPIEFANGGIVVSFGGGTDLTVPGQQLVIEWDIKHAQPDYDTVVMYNILAGRELLNTVKDAIIGGEKPVPKSGCFHKSLPENPKRKFQIWTIAVKNML